MLDPLDNPAIQRLVREMQRRENDPAFQHIVREMQRRENDPAFHRLAAEADRRQNLGGHSELLLKNDQQPPNSMTKLVEDRAAALKPIELFPEPSPTMSDRLSFMERSSDYSPSIRRVLMDLTEHFDEVAKFDSISPSWGARFGPSAGFNQTASSKLESALNAQVTRIEERNLLAQSAVIGLRMRDLGCTIEPSSAARVAAELKYSMFAESYGNLIESYGHPMTSILSLAPNLSELASVEFFNTANFIRATSIRVDTESESENGTRNEREEVSEFNNGSLPELLSELDPDLLRLWEGAKQAQLSANPDKIRHSAISLRELLTQVLHRLSPDDDLRSWSTSSDDFANGRPTRRARLRFIARNINHDPFTDFVESDINVTLAFFKLVNSGTHTVNSGLTESQLAALRLKAESTICFMILTSRSENECDH